MDVGTVHTVDGGKCYMCLLSCWGFVADVDIESEKWRRIGEARFVLGELCRKLNLPPRPLLPPVFQYVSTEVEALGGPMILGRYTDSQRAVPN